MEGRRAPMGLPPAFLSNHRKPTFPERENDHTPTEELVRCSALG